MCSYRRIFSPNAPAGELIGDAYYRADERANIRQVARELSRFLGPAPVEDHLNTLRAEWRCDRAGVRLLAWPRERQFARSDDRDPRLQLGCYITIHTGLRPEPGEAEREQLRSFVPICALPPRRDRGESYDWYINQSEMEFMRDAAGIAGNVGQIGLSADGGALIFHADDLFMLDMAKVQSVRVLRVQPAKGPGGSTLQIDVLTDYDGVARKEVTVCEAPGADDLSEIAAIVASAIERPLNLEPYSADC